MPSNRRIRAFATLVLTLVPFLSAQAQQQEQKAPSTPVFRSRTDLVLVPVIVNDRSGKHVPGLKKEDFVVEQDGQSQPLVLFEEVQTTNDVKRPKLNHEFTNEVSAEKPARMTIIAVDMINTSFLDQAYARQQLLKYLSKRVEAQEPTALYAIHLGGLSVIHDFTGDHEALITALKDVSGQATSVDKNKGFDKPEQGIYQQAQDRSLAANPRLSESLAVQNFVNGVGLQLGLADQLQSMQTTLSAFQQIAQAFAGVPGRKTLIWATAGFPYSISSSAGLSSPQMRIFQSTAGSAPTGMSGDLPQMADTTSIYNNSELSAVEPMYERTLRMLADANIAVYPVDARGLVTLDTDASSYSGKISAIEKDLFRQSLDTMKNFADITGGKAFYNRNDLDVAFKKASDDNEQYYMVGYYLPKDKKRDPWRKLKVKVNKPDVEVRARTGFMADTKTNNKTAAELRRQEIQTALIAPVAFTAVPMRVSFNGSQPAGDKKKVQFSLYLPPGAVSIGSEKNDLNIEVAAVAKTKQGKFADQFSQTLAQQLKPEAVATISKDGINYSNVLTVPPGEYDVYFVVRDNVSNRQGSVIAPVKIQ